ncbi:MAG TPA: hypothetical protein VFK38_07680 [Candidatus Limnocylindrales bacterium]|nr:hypothetical protein [Candidatus Limnocylindrales bacterium]
MATQQSRGTGRRAKTPRSVAPAARSTSASPIDGSPQGSTQLLYRSLLWQGLSLDEAANLVALAAGIRPVENGWRLREVQGLLFLRHLARQGRLVS